VSAKFRSVRNGCDGTIVELEVVLGDGRPSPESPVLPRASLSAIDETVSFEWRTQC